MTFLDLNLTMALKKLKKDETMTINQIAKACGVHTRVIKKIENDALEKLRKNKKLKSYAENM